MYVNPNFKTKKELKEAVEAGKRVEIYSPGFFPAKTNGAEFVEGPHFPKPHKWYGKVEVKNGLVVKVY
jgi:hypothetical protein